MVRLYWIKIKYLFDDDFVVCGYIHKENNMVSFVLGQYNSQKELIYKGHVAFGMRSDDKLPHECVESK